MISLPKQLVVIGDSSVYGWGDNEGGGWCERLRKDWINNQNGPVIYQQAKSYLAYCAYRSDIIIRETAIVGVIGSVGLGWQLQESLSSFARQEVTLVLIAYSSIAIVGELINGKIKNSLT